LLFFLLLSLFLLSFFFSFISPDILLPISYSFTFLLYWVLLIPLFYFFSFLLLFCSSISFPFRNCGFHHKLPCFKILRCLDYLGLHVTVLITIFACLKHKKGIVFLSASLLGDICSDSINLEVQSQARCKYITD
jgi:hypothetical protein